MTASMSESVVEQAALDWFQGLGYTVIYGPDIAPGEFGAERATWSDVMLVERVRAALRRLNPEVPPVALDEALRKLQRLDSPSLVVNNHAFHRMLVNGVEVEYVGGEGRVVGDRVVLMDFERPDTNDWVVVNQFTVIEGGHNRRPDLVVFINGLPLATIELKNSASESATIWTAFNQLQTYKQQIPSIFAYNEILVISDGLEARVGTISSDQERFLPWRTIEGEDLAPEAMPQLQVVILGMFEHRRFLDLVRHFIVFEQDGPNVIKKMAGYHQFHAVNSAVISTVEAASPSGNRRIGVVWHTQGSGKSLTMAFYAGRVVLHPAMENPSLVVLTDRNDLDDQLFTTFARCQDLLRQQPAQAENRADLRRLLKVASGGVVFTTIQKFLPEARGDSYPLLSDRRNIIVIADEAHRSQYDFMDGFARHLRDALPNASFIGFTGTPLESADKNTRAVFGDYISIYDIQRAVEDGATVPIYYEGRLAKLELDERERPHLDMDFEEVTEGEETEAKEKLKSRWAQLEAIVGTDKRINLIAKDLVEHFENRLATMDGKAMVVCMSRRICVDLYDAIIRLRPEWHHDDDDKGVIKVVMTGSASDKAEWQHHIRNKPRREALAKRMKDAKDQLKIVIVRDMWLTGFDAPSIHTMYIDKPMQGHNLMQAIARVNRVFKDKPGGLVVDYLGLADQLKKALANYTENGGKGTTALDQNEAVAVMLEKYEICCDLFHGFEFRGFAEKTAAQKLETQKGALEHVLSLPDGKQRFVQAVVALSKAFSLAVPHDEALRIRDDVAFFQLVKSALVKSGGGGGRSGEDLEHAIRQIVSRAVAPDGVVDIFTAAGLDRPDISILSDEFLAEIKGMQHRNLAVELLQRLLRDEIKARSKKNLVQSRSFAEMLEAAIRKYQNRSIEAAQVIAELIELAKEIRKAKDRGEALGLTDDELAFYDALGTNDSAVMELGDDILRQVARELTETVKKNVTIDWTVKDSVRANLRRLVKRLLRKYGYPPDKTETAITTVLQQAEHLGQDWALTQL